MANSQLKWKWVVSIRKLNKRIQKSTHTHRENNNTQVENVKKANTICGGCEKRVFANTSERKAECIFPKRNRVKKSAKKTWTENKKNRKHRKGKQCEE